MCEYLDSIETRIEGFLGSAYGGRLNDAWRKQFKAVLMDLTKARTESAEVTTFTYLEALEIINHTKDAYWSPRFEMISDTNYVLSGKDYASCGPAQLYIAKPHPDFDANFPYDYVELGPKHIKAKWRLIEVSDE